MIQESLPVGERRWNVDRQLRHRRVGADHGEPIRRVFGPPDQGSCGGALARR